MQILLTNDDGIYAPGLAALHRALCRLGDVCVVAPATEQSGVGHSITYLNPLMAKQVFDGDRPLGWAVEGSPADCVKLGLGEFCPTTPDIVVSGINGGLNIGINVLYSGTVAAATEGAVHDITSIAVSLEMPPLKRDDHADFDRAAEISGELIEQILAQPGANDHRLYSINLPTAALSQETPEVRVVPMAVKGWTTEFERRVDPKGRQYYWSSGTPPMAGPETDIGALNAGFVTLTPLSVDRSKHQIIERMQDWELTPVASPTTTPATTLDL